MKEFFTKPIGIEIGILIVAALISVSLILSTVSRYDFFGTLILVTLSVASFFGISLITTALINAVINTIK